MKNESTLRTIIVTIVLSLICSVLVSLSVVMLKPLKEKNVLLDLQKNILNISGLAKNADLLTDREIANRYKNIQPKLVDIKEGRFLNVSIKEIEMFNQKSAAKDLSKSMAVPRTKDIARIGRMSNIAKVYLIKKDNRITSIMLPVHGYGLWSTMYGFVALDINDLDTVVGFGFYSQGETPGLGGEVDNPAWKKLWPGKKVYDVKGNVALRLIKGTVNTKDSNAKYEIDGLAGATLTSQGVSNLIKFWLGKDGFKAFLKNLKAGEL